ncbi:MAG: amidohydrolase family protein [Candidatus Cloacimonetes bacterium]|nr:amidohydrolase family protein [Candidatus Cloacimonadota bacterium]
MVLIKNASIMADGIIRKSDILFNEKILELAKEIVTSAEVKVIDLDGKLLIPGCIDAHVHFNDPGFTQRENFTSGTEAAACGGITTVIDMPCTSIPAVTNVENLKTKLSVINSKSLVDFALWGGIRRNDFPIKEETIAKLWSEGVVGFKIYTISGMESFEALTYDDIKSIFNDFPKILFAFHAEDKKIIVEAENNLTNEEKKLPENYIKMRPVKAEFIAVKQILSSLSENNSAHFVHISSKKAAELILQSKENSDITFETCPHYLQFIAADIPILKGRVKTAPPVKFKDDKEFLRNCLKIDQLDFVTTDHAGSDYKTGKEFDNFSKVYNGIPGTELMIPYIFSEFYLKEKVNLRTIIKITSENAAKRFGLYPNKGSLKIGTDADFTIIDLNRSFKVDESKLHSLGKYSPFDQKIFNCSVDRTIVRGKTVFDREHGIMQSPGFGKFIRRI